MTTRHRPFVRATRALVLALAAAALGACASSDGLALDRRAGQTAVDVPPWVGQLIDSLAAEPVAHPPLSVTRYVYRGGYVYYVPARCCDIMSVLFAADGTELCRPDGGLAGSGDGRCADFADARRSGTLIWLDPRT